MLWHCLEASAEAAVPLGERACPTNGRDTTACLWQVVSKCALRGGKKEYPRFPGDLPADLIVLRQLLYQIILQHRRFHRPHPVSYTHLTLPTNREV